MKRLLIAVYILIFSGLNGICQDKTSEKKPKLIIGIVIDQMRYDVIQKYWNKFENNGFKRLVNEGTVCRNVYYNSLVSRSCVSYTTIATGANPSVHGIISDDWYLRVSDKIVHCTRDTSVKSLGGTFEGGTYSPRNMLVTTVGDELRFTSQKTAKVVAMSLDASNSVLVGGHQPNASYWLDPETGEMISCNYYMAELPVWVKDFNRKKLAEAYLDRSWEPLNPLETYDDTSSIMNDDYLFRGQKKFPYDLKKASAGKDKKTYGLLKYTPFGINFLKDFAIASIVNEQLGKDDITDMLFVGFTSPGNIAQTFGLNSMEMQDAYIRLDKEIRHFLDFIDGYLGKNNVLVFLTSSQGGSYSPSLMQQKGMSTGFYNSNQALALTRSYLNALHGADFIKHYNNLQFYLNENKIRNANKSFEVIQKDMAEFLDDFTGVHHVALSNDLLREGYTDGVNQKIQNSFHPKRSGDVIVYLEPGWVEKRGSSYNYISAGNSETHVPLIWYGWKIKKKTIYRDIEITDVAPTLSTILEIAYPNGCGGKAILEIIE